MTDDQKLSDHWCRTTSCLDEVVGTHFKEAQDHAYELGIKRGREQAAIIAESVAMESPTTETANYDTATAYHIAWKIRR